MHPAHMNGDPAHFAPVVTQLSEHVRALEHRLFGRSHPQTVSLFGPILDSHPEVADTIFRHPMLDFASTHLYAEGTIDHPRDTVAPALKVGDLVREALGHLPPGRPYLDSEHGPIHSFKDKKKTLAEAFDNEYFRHIQWAHLASGGAGGGMRWPNRRPHTLTRGMRAAQGALARFLPLLDWSSFHRRNISQSVGLEGPVHGFVSGDNAQAVAWLLRSDSLDRATGRLRTDAPSATVCLTVPGLEPGSYEALGWDTRDGTPDGRFAASCKGGLLALDVPVTTDLALAIRKVP
jgi:mannan endo-1,4-beta-mannosidase